MNWPAWWEAPPGYVGYSESTSTVLSQINVDNPSGSGPYSSVLFDEIEKAHPDLFDFLLGIAGKAVRQVKQHSPQPRANTIESLYR
jgi:ATP-dependent Clp protease ATP-binding subunit ClpA